MTTARAAAVVRKEFFGPLIWSEGRHAYFIPVSEAAKRQALQAVDQSVAGRWVPRDDSAIEQELALLGIGGPVRVLESPYSDRISAPLEIYFDYTWVCNLAKHKCGQDAFCYAQDFLGPTTMRPERVRELIAELADLGVMRLHLAGGEPTVNKRGLANYLDSAHEFGLYSSMATNGLLMTDEVVSIILRNNLKSVSFSLDGASEETHGAVRGPGLFERTICGIKRLIELRDRAGSRMRVCIKPTYEPSTPDDELEAIVRLGIDLGVDVVKFANPERCLHHEQGHYGRQVDEYYAKIKFIGHLQERFGGKVAITNVSNPMAGCGDIGLPGLQGCVGAQELLAINPDGSITPCLMHQLKLGNVLTEYQGVRDFWQSSDALPAFWTALTKPAGCTDCSIYSRCRSGSTTRRIVQIGRFNADRTSGEFTPTKDPLCPQDYLNRHPEAELPDPVPEPGSLTHFREVAVRHSL